MKIAVKVKNCEGTDNSKVWINEWKEGMKRVPKQCSNVLCNNTEDICGGHVIKVDGVLNNTYIVPICRSCNAIPPDEVYSVYADDMMLLE